MSVERSVAAASLTVPRPGRMRVITVKWLRWLGRQVDAVKWLRWLFGGLRRCATSNKAAGKERTPNGQASPRQRSRQIYWIEPAAGCCYFYSENCPPTNEQMSDDKEKRHGAQIFASLRRVEPVRYRAPRKFHPILSLQNWFSILGIRLLSVCPHTLYLELILVRSDDRYIRSFKIIFIPLNRPYILLRRKIYHITRQYLPHQRTISHTVPYIISTTPCHNTIPPTYHVTYRATPHNVIPYRTIYHTRQYHTIHTIPNENAHTNLKTKNPLLLQDKKCWQKIPGIKCPKK